MPTHELPNGVTVVADVWRPPPRALARDDCPDWCAEDHRGDDDNEHFHCSHMLEIDGQETHRLDVQLFWVTWDDDDNPDQPMVDVHGVHLSLVQARGLAEVLNMLVGLAAGA
jgi:hypothetical protein